MLTERRRRGRPREVSAMRSAISVRVSARVHDDVILQANAAGVTVTEWMRRAVFSVLYKSDSASVVPQ